MNNTMIIIIFNRDTVITISTYIKTQHCQIMTTIGYRILKFVSMIKKTIIANDTFFAFVTFSKISSLAYINSIVIQHL